MEATAWDKARILDILANPTVGNNPAIVFKMLKSMMNRQTLDEQATATTRHQNGVGFNGPDANFMTYWYNQAVKYRGNIAPWRLEEIASRLQKYAGQLEEIAQANIAAKVTTNVQAEAEVKQQPALDTFNRVKQPVSKRRNKRTAGLSRQEKAEQAEAFFESQESAFLQHARTVFGPDFGTALATA